MLGRLSHDLVTISGPFTTKNFLNILFIPFLAAKSHFEGSDLGPLLKFWDRALDTFGGSASDR